MHRARAALRDAAAELGAGQAEQVAQYPKQRHIGGRVDAAGLTVDVECDHVETFRWRWLEGFALLRGRRKGGLREVLSMATPSDEPAAGAI
jgi:hypothetical protein